MARIKGSVTDQETRDKIKKSLLETKEKRALQICRTYLLKIDHSHLSKYKKDSIDNLFTQGKYLYNNILASDDLYNYSTDRKEVEVKVNDKLEMRSISNLYQQQKFNIYKKITSSIRSLSTRKSKGYKVGRLKFKSIINWLPIQYSFDKRNRNYIKFNKIKVKIRGLDQIPKGAELCNAQLLRKGKDYYISITTFIDKSKLENHNVKNKSKFDSIGIDYGIGTQLTFSNGVKVNYRIPITDRIKRQHRRVSKKVKGSKNRFKSITKLNSMYDKLTNIKTDINNKLVSYLVSNHSLVYHQDDNISSWSKWWGRRIHETSIGGIKGGLKSNPSTSVLVDRWYPSTKTCSSCGATREMKLSDRTYQCNKCNLYIDRDYNSAINIENEGYNKLTTSGTNFITINIPRDPRELTPEERSTSSLRMVEYLRTLPYLNVSTLDESGSPERDCEG